MIPDTILSNVAQEYGITVAMLKGRDRTALVAEARAAAIKALYIEGLTMAKIGEILNRHESTVSMDIRRAW